MPIVNIKFKRVRLIYILFSTLTLAILGIFLLRVVYYENECISSKNAAGCDSYVTQFKGMNVGFFAKKEVITNAGRLEDYKKAVLGAFDGGDAIYSDNVRYAIPTDFKKMRPQFEAIRTFNNQHYFSNFEIDNKKVTVGILAGPKILQNEEFLEYKSGVTLKNDTEFCENCFGNSDIDIVFYCRKKLLDLGYCNTQFMEKIKFEEGKLFRYGDIIEGVEDYSDDLKTFLDFGMRVLNELTELEESGTLSSGNSPSAMEKNIEELGILFYTLNLIKPKFGQFRSSAAAGGFVGGQISLKSPKRNRVICLMEVDSKVQGDISLIDACITRVKNPKLELGFSNGTLPKFYN